MDYAEFLASKRRREIPTGRTIEPGDTHPSLHQFQRDMTAWAVRTGRAALWWDTGLGKTRAQLEWARLSADRSLIIAPLAVCRQTVNEASRLGMSVPYVRNPDGITGRGGVWITNYEMVRNFDPSMFGAVVLDEASILKNFAGKTRNQLIAMFRDVPHRLACTATPAPNDITELTSQAEFLGILKRQEMLASYFVNDGKEWRVKHHARIPMFHWMATWAAALRSPADAGYPAEGYDLPPLYIIPHVVETAEQHTAGGITGRQQMRAATVEERVARAVDLFWKEPDEQWLFWCGRNDEAEQLAAAIPDAVNVHGSMSPEEKADLLVGFANGTVTHMVTKPSIAGFGMNWQHCARTAFVGLSDSWESYYQAIRRCWRYGQTRPVYAHVIVSDIESVVADNIARKDADASAMVDDMIKAMNYIRDGGHGL